MNTKKVLLFSFLIFTFPIIASSIDVCTLQHKLEDLQTFGDSSIIAQDENKIYFNFERLIFDPNGIFLENDLGELVPINNLSCINGVYTMVRPGYWVCPKCGNINKNEWSMCHNCRFPED